MNNSGSNLSTAIQTEQAVRSAYEQTSRRHRFKQQWSRGTPWERVCLTVAPVLLAASAVCAAASWLTWYTVYPAMMIGMVLLAYGVVATERRLFGEHFRAYGEQLNTRDGEPSRLRYLYFINNLRQNEQVQAKHLERLIPALEARINYRDYFFRRFPVLILLSTLVAMLTASGIAQPIFWTTSLGPQLLIMFCMAWLIAFIFGRQWRSLRPTPQTRERELVAFLHMALMDLEAPPLSSYSPKPEPDRQVPRVHTSTN